MNAKTINPVLGAESFNCPSCGALAHQSWYEVYCNDFEKGRGPWTPAPDAPEQALANRDVDDPALRRTIADYFRKRLLQLPFFDPTDQSVWLRLSLENVYVSKCYSCSALAVWVYDKPIFPPSTFSAQPNADLDDEIKLDFREATRILDLSPRGAAALLRLCVQKLCVQLGEAGKNIDTDIGSLVEKGLEPSLQQALDIVRVIGNESVHPGQIDLRDNRETAMKLFGLVNIIADAMISRPKQIAELYGTLPATKLEAIEKRDGAKTDQGGPDRKPPRSS
jgi:hypothetical protein